MECRHTEVPPATADAAAASSRVSVRHSSHMLEDSSPVVSEGNNDALRNRSDYRRSGWDRTPTDQAGSRFAQRKQPQDVRGGTRPSYNAARGGEPPWPRGVGSGRFRNDSVLPMRDVTDGPPREPRASDSQWRPLPRNSTDKTFTSRSWRNHEHRDGRTNPDYEQRAAGKTDFDYEHRRAGRTEFNDEHRAAGRADFPGYRSSSHSVQTGQGSSMEQRNGDRSDVLKPTQHHGAKDWRSQNRPYSGDEPQRYGGREQENWRRPPHRTFNRGDGRPSQGYRNGPGSAESRPDRLTNVTENAKNEQRPARSVRSPVSTPTYHNKTAIGGENAKSEGTTGVVHSECKQNGGLDQQSSPSNDGTPGEAQEVSHPRLGNVQRANYVAQLPLSELTEEELRRRRTTEIDLFRKRYPKSKEDGENAFKFVFSPTDPDWPFDVKHLHLKITFPTEYPSKPLCVTVMNPDDVLPVILVEDIDIAIEKWIQFFHKPGQLSFRPFLRWIDRNLQDIFIESLRKIKRLQEEKQQSVDVLVDQTNKKNQPELTNYLDGHEVGPGTQLNDKNSETLERKDEQPVLKALPKKQDRILDQDDGLDAVGSSKSEVPTKVAHQGAVSNNQLAKILNNYDPHSAPRKGIEIKFRHVDLSESVSFLICDRLLVSVQCKKCKKIADFQLLPGRRSVSHCAKCQTKLEACFRPGILLQFNPVLGYLELQDCTIRDVALSRCHFYVDCQDCSKLSPAEGVHMGQRSSKNCQTCSTKMQIMMDSIKYMDLCAIETNIKAAQQKKANKDSGIQAGKPLPGKGICKHYKKSFRWFRFPCCGKAYPCDDCHNEQETDHTAEFASRMICGFCAKEQPFSNDKPCSQCSNFITGRHTAHWEGGKGCRNRTKMNSNDAKKFAGLNKTISRKATAAKSK